MFYDGSALWPSAVALSFEVCRPPLSFLSGPPIQHSVCDSQWPAKCANLVVLHLCSSRRLCGGPFLYPRFSSRPIAAPIGRPARYFEGKKKKKEKRRDGKEKREKRKRWKGRREEIGRERERERVRREKKVAATRFAKPRTNRERERERSEVWLCIGRQICVDD